MRDKTLVTALLGSGLILGLSFAQQPSGQTQSNNTGKEGAQQTCFKSVCGEKCGDDVELSYMMCGEQKCVTHERRYDHLYSTETSESGFMEICVKMCKEHEYTRMCNEFYECVLLDEKLHDALPGTVACGDACTPGPKKKGTPD